MLGTEILFFFWGLAAKVLNTYEPAHVKGSLSHRGTVKAHTSLHTCADLPEPLLFAVAI